jgi:mannose-1-phosphate guanylyltransferase/mannose-6-phosphate isomerase
MAGGSGTRLWPLSRAGFPKQFLVLSGNTQPVPAGRARLQGLAADADHAWPPRWWWATRSTASWCWTSCANRKSTPPPCCWSPMGRNTAPAVTLAALQALETGADPVLVVTPADQTVTDGGLHRRAAARRASAAQAPS